jgi:DNA-binding MarR family transcriptional regulator
MAPKSSRALRTQRPEGPPYQAQPLRKAPFPAPLAVAAAGFDLRPPGYEPPRIGARVPPYSAQTQVSSWFSAGAMHSRRAPQLKVIAHSAGRLANASKRPPGGALRSPRSRTRSQRVQSYSTNRPGTRSSITEIAEGAQLTKQAVVCPRERVEALDYVERIRDVDDRRPKLVRSPAHGRAAVIDAREAAAAIEREWAKLIGVNRLRDLHNLVEQLNDALRSPSAEE